MTKKNIEDIAEFLLVTATAGLGIIAADPNYAAQAGEVIDKFGLELDEFKALLMQVVDTALRLHLN